MSKDVQVPDYKGKERPTRPKYDILDYSTEQMATLFAECLDCDVILPPEDPCCGGGGGGGSTASSTFVSSESLGGHAFWPNQYTDNPSNYIQDLKIRKGSSPTINTSDLPGYYKIPVDLNRGAGGQYIYLCFTRDPEKVQGSSRWVDDTNMGRKIPVRDIHIESQRIGTKPQFYDVYWTPVETKDGLGFHQPDLNDGAGGRYIYAYQVKGNNSNPAVKEVGVIYGNSSSIQPPAGWERISGDLNEGAGGDYIYFCVKY